MTRFAKAIFALAVFGLLGNSAAQAAPDLTGKSGSTARGNYQQGETALTIKSTAPGEADLTFTDNAGVVLNQQPSGTVMAEEPDKSGKGTAYVVAGTSYDGAIFGLTGVGPAWAGTGSGNDTRFDLSRMYTANMNGASVTVHISIPKGSFGTVFAVVPVIVDTHGRLLAWGSHPAGVTRHMLTRSDGTTDMLTILSVDGNGTIRPATDAEVALFQKTYRSFF
ncbi:MAG: hypothetical protein HGA16_00065 [Candidatus Moranbacteria bacterium]|nr:hypothetical protein [Candidatus Moranbacteria bacterium]